MVRTQRWRGGSSAARARWVAAVVMLLAAGCSAEESTTPTVELSSTSTPITTEPTTTEPPTTEAPTTTEDPRIAEVEAAVVAFRETQVEVLTNPDAPLELLEEVAGGDVLARARENTAKARAEGRTFVGSFERTTTIVNRVDETVFELVECSHDRVEVLDSGGQLVVAADPEPYLQRLELHYEDAAWLVMDVTFVGSEKQPCDL